MINNLPANAQDAGNASSIPGSGRSHGGGKWQPAPVFLLGKSHGQRNLVGCSPWGPKESDMRVTQHACMYLDINLTIRVKDLYTKHHKTLLKEIQDIIKWKNTPCSLIRTLNIYKMAAAAAAKSLQSCPTLCDPIDGSPPGSPVPGILQARTLEWAAIAFSSA